MALEGKTKIHQSKKARTQYITIPSYIVSDSQYPFKPEDEVEIVVDPARETILIKKRGEFPS